MLDSHPDKREIDKFSEIHVRGVVYKYIVNIESVFTHSLENLIISIKQDNF